ncbi:hypothetical protein [Cupriavidus necator]|uniref:hypothetical protein n=1 Tax=Cupriavidus necator TaxID=106590 RepID=UPI00277DF145|nr:hypothetical protein [Cupriavidus necator]MDQ0140971.1 integrase [Cupriavidus necator]
MKRAPKTTPSAASAIHRAAGNESTFLGIPDVASREEEIDASRSRALIDTSAQAVQSLDVERVLVLQNILQHGAQYGHWRTPTVWDITERSEARRNIDLRRRIVSYLPERLRNAVLETDVAIKNGLPSERVERISSLTMHPLQVRRILDGAVLTLTRYLVLLRMGPAGRGRAMNISLDPTNVKGIGYQFMAALLSIGVSKLLTPEERDFGATNSNAKALSFEGGYLSLVQPEDLDGWSKSMRKGMQGEALRMSVLAERGYWSDVPAVGENLEPVTKIAGPEKPIKEEDSKDSHLPLPDEYVSDLGHRSIWLIQELAPHLLAIAKEIQRIWECTEDVALKPRSVLVRRRRQLAKFLSGYVWRDSQGRTIYEPPFKIRLNQQGKNSNVSKKAAKAPTATILEWPPGTFVDILGLMQNLQLAHLFVVALSTGGRKSETLGLKRSCVQYAPNGKPYACGRTFKLVRRHDGELRDWVLPDLAVQALEQQVRLIELVEAIGPMCPERSASPLAQIEPSAHLWGRISGKKNEPTSPLLDLNAALKTYATAMGMDTAPGGQSLRSHRLRKTVARLVALALTQAPKVLMDVFGHKSIEMTLYYILTDKDLQADIEQVARELRVMRAKKVVEEIVMEEEAQTIAARLGGYGGPAAVTVDRAITVHKDRLHRQGESWGADSAMELADILTLQGKAWQLVRPGVICTKFPGTESGPCNRSKGHPEPSRCQSSCKHRLEEAFLREDVDGAIRESVNAYLESGKNGEELVQAHWAGQVRAHIGRFEDLRVKWMENPTVRQLVTDVSAEGAVA